jgi:spore coat polysaccharide biosynthesis protein SpsF
MTDAPQVAAVVRARMHAGRLPGKALLEAGGLTMLAHVVERLRASSSIGEIAVATTADMEDDAIADECERLGVPCFRGSVEDVLGRVAECAGTFRLGNVAHFGADNPLIDPAVCNLAVGTYLASDGILDYVTNNMPPTFPDGLEVEVTSAATLRRCAEEASDPRHREHMLSYIWENPDSFATLNVMHEPNLHHERWTLDFPEDWQLVRALIEALSPANPVFGMEEILAHLDTHPELRKVNATHRDDYPWRT